MCVVVNKRTYRGGGVYVGRPSVLGNPYVEGKDGTRAEVIAKYRVWLNAKVKANDPAIMRALRSIPENATLICWCAPLPCHADVVARAIAYVRSCPQAQESQAQ